MCAVPAVRGRGAHSESVAKSFTFIKAVIISTQFVTQRTDGKVIRLYLCVTLESCDKHEREAANRRARTPRRAATAATVVVDVEIEWKSKAKYIIK